MKKYYIFLLIIFILSCSNKKSSINTFQEKNTQELNINNTSIIILGTIQDAGSPQIGCNKSCCINLFENPDISRQIVSLGLIDTKKNKTY